MVLVYWYWYWLVVEYSEKNSHQNTTADNNNTNSLSTPSSHCQLHIMLRLSRPLVKQVKTVRYYHENIIDHYENPRNVGSLDKNKTNVGTGDSIRRYPLIRNYAY
jgi:hypothetical protein